MTALERFADLQRQGFMRSAKRKPKAKRETVACDDCLDWHERGKHIADASTRKANRTKRKLLAARVSV